MPDALVSLMDGSWPTVVLSGLCLVLFLPVVLARMKFLRPLKDIPYPTALPIIGNAYQLNCTQEEFFKKLTKWAEKFGDIFLIWVGQRPFIFLYRVEAVQPLLSNSNYIDKSLEYQYLKPWLGTGLVTSSGEKWFFRRKLLTPSFHSTLLEGYLKTVKEEVKVLISCLETEIGNWFNVVPYTKRATLDIICDTAMGYKLNAQRNSKDEYVEAVDKIASIVQMRFTNVWVSSDLIFKLTKAGKEHDRSLRIIHGFVDKVLAERKAAWKLKHDDNFNKSSTKKKQALLDLLLNISEDGAVLSDEDIREEVNTFMYAGHDTVATSIAWSLYALGRNPEYQEKILNEYDELLGNEEITLDNLHKLTWLDASIKEQWRIYPVAPLIARQIYTPIKLMGRQIPPGSTVLINSYLLHRDPRYFPDPDVYRPERFLPDSPKLPPYVFIPFSAGSRNCIGWKFATLIIKFAVLSILKNFHVESLDKEDQLRFISELVLINANGIRLKLTPRERYPAN
ncbi:cytochrome P450 4c3-like [Pseudomyrmex gracilis]|uniref:cytochrome P450 4c3-like n=1 Tax=Pseudomyrmex gracilis TaxID=219809 RepID=UPI000994DE02|nr:cytochrome P450 4c3-like [Pseudomyrmex gracilis]XP_020283971.1 cytochrome P450 4c3-like [Pseudomyrmex gracilis]XP_020283972.1 cytochrome P450 4c3-like [Pseudomyrmex gracilis]XP_020283973.1 cytochrome P450 4c3-like [Pseudomyrmex gracilis]XP_020283974.1 cytochrome P450 4c3-like [Pseudomyrmex gracilis]